MRPTIGKLIRWNGQFLFYVHTCIRVYIEPNVAIIIKLLYAYNVLWLFYCKQQQTVESRKRINQLP